MEPLPSCLSKGWQASSGQMFGNWKGFQKKKIFVKLPSESIRRKKRKWEYFIFVCGYRLPSRLSTSAALAMDSSEAAIQKKKIARRPGTTWNSTPGRKEHKCFCRIVDPRVAFGRSSNRQGNNSKKISTFGFFLHSAPVCGRELRLSLFPLFL